jgi:beta-lactamase class D
VNNAKVDNSLKKYFDENNVDGCFTLLNNANGEVTVYNMALDTQRFSPASTFQIVNSLIGLQTGRITDENMRIKEDSMTMAFKTYDVPYFQEVARRIGRDTMKMWVDSIGYGNKDIDGPIDSFWFNNHLKISADEQLGLVKRLYFDQLPFRKSAQQIIRDLMLKDDNTAYKLSWIISKGKDEKANDLSWFTGWIEENNHVYFFVTFVKATKPGTDLDAVMKITEAILKDKGFMQGKK